MAAKRARNDQLTGGSGDVNPQFAHVVATQAGVNGFIEAEVPFPALSMMSTIGSGLRAKGAVLELLWVDWQFGGVEFNAAGESYLFSLTRNTQPNVIFISDPDAIVARVVESASGATDTGSYNFERDGRYELTSGDGHGMLVSIPSNNSLRLQFFTAGFAAIAAMHMRIAYRIKLVPIAEFIGMMASRA